MVRLFIKAGGIPSQKAGSVTKQQLTNELIRWYCRQNKLSDALTFLEQQNTSASKEILFDLYLEEKDYTKAQNILNARCAQNDDESMAYCKLNTLVLNWARGGSSPYTMSRSDKATLASLATGFTGSSGQAQAILRKVFDEITGPVYSGDSARARMSWQDDVSPGISQFALYPNPVNDDVLFISSHITGLNEVKALVRIYDVTGKMKLDVEKIFNDDAPITLNIAGLGIGIYFMELQLDGYPAQFQKLIIE